MKPLKPNDKRLNVAEAYLDADEIDALTDVVRDGWITMGPRVDAFEKAFAARSDAQAAVAVSSCTAGLHLVLAALGIGLGDEVLVPSMTFVATVNAILYVGAKPLFVDISGPEDASISLDDARSKMSERTRAAIVVHYAGSLVPGDAWRRFAEAEGLLLIEDAAHAAGVPGAGSFGDAAVFSFYGNKNMTTAEGGMVTARDPDLLQCVRTLRSHGMTSGTFERHHKVAPRYDVTMLGWNYRMDELRAAIGLVQLARLEGWNRRRRELVDCYFDALATYCPQVRIAAGPPGQRPVHILPALLPDGIQRDDVAASLYDDGIQTSFHYPPVHQLDLYRRLCPHQYLPLTEEFGNRQITLPLHPGMTEGQVKQVARSLARCVETLSLVEEGVVL